MSLHDAQVDRILIVLWDGDGFVVERRGRETARAKLVIPPGDDLLGHGRAVLRVGTIDVVGTLKETARNLIQIVEPRHVRRGWAETRTS